MKVALAQINPVVGDIPNNVSCILDVAREAHSAGADIVVFPELAVCGYPPLDLVHTAGFLDANESALQQLARETASLSAAIVVGCCSRSVSSDRPMNGAACIYDGEVVFRQNKSLLPTYDVFDESRYFEPGSDLGVWHFGGTRLGLTICEDVWNDKQFWERARYGRDPVEELAATGIDLLINISSSPFHTGKRAFRREMLGATASRHGVPIVFVNQVGGNDQLVFDGSSFVVDGDGALRAQASSFTEDVVIWDTGEGGDVRIDDPLDMDESAAVLDALVLGTRDYVRKCGFRSAIIGLSGGIDSAVTAAIAVEALGSKNVMGVAMPGPYSSEGSVVDAKRSARALGIRLEILGIRDAYETCLESLGPVFEGMPANVAEENLQARLRGVTLMALSNKLRGLVLTTGNKSELAVGYCTLYGDMCGGLAVISDVPKTLVYRIARVANQRRPGAIPETVLAKPPSAELRPDQKDSDSLPPYEVMDPILQLYVEENMSVSAIAEQRGQPHRLVQEIVHMVDRNEYKRQQAAPGLRVTSKAFGMGRRMPIAQRYIR